MIDIEFRAFHEGIKKYVTGSTANMFQWVEDGQPILLEQYTGVIAKDNKKLFEGDRVNHPGIPGGYLGTIKRSKGAYVIKWDEEAKDDLLYDYDITCNKLEIIGTIHD